MGRVKSKKPPVVQFPSTRNSFKWTPDIHEGMAMYLRDNYDSYKKSLSDQRKTEFLRRMCDHLGITPNDKQMRNGFTHFIHKYDGMKQKLNSSGFGIDPEKDATLDKDVVLKGCPYYFILDEVMSTRPNINPPVIVSTSGYGNVGSDPVDQNISYPAVIMSNDESELSMDSGEQEGIAHVIQEDQGTDNNTNGNQEAYTVNEEIGPSENESQTNAYVRQTLSGIKVKKDAISMKTPLGVFAKVMGDKIEETSKVEREKLQVQVSQFEEQKFVQRERNEIERFKVESQIELDKRRLDLEEKRLEEKKAEREHELIKLKMEQEFQLKQMELKLKLQNQDSL